MNILPTDFKLNKYGLDVRFINENDATFIVGLRTDERLGRYINSTSPKVEDQIRWTEQYKKREAEGIDYYFIFEKMRTPLGVCRIYDIRSGEFTIGSWLFKKDAPVGTAILGDIITREVAFGLFPDSTLLFDVRKDNFNVNRYQVAYKPEIIDENQLNYYYSCSRENFEKYKERYIKMFYKL